jgi:hypothetical protein
MATRAMTRDDLIELVKAEGGVVTEPEFDAFGVASLPLSGSSLSTYLVLSIGNTHE